MNTTYFGKYLRKLRIDTGELLKDMATRLGITPSYLSAIEIGKRNIPKDMPNAIIMSYNLNDYQARELMKSVAYSSKVIKLNVENLDREDKSLIFELVKKIKNLSEEDKIKIKDILKH